MKRDFAEWVKSPNFSFSKTRQILLVVIHATATKGTASPLEWLCNKNAKASAHYLLAKDGHVYQLVSESNIAWHAGVSEWGGHKNINEISIGIELTNSNDGLDKYPEAQITKCAYLVSQICDTYGLYIQDVVGHVDVAPKRKTDPLGFDWDDFRMRLADLKVPSRKVNA